MKRTYLVLSLIIFNVFISCENEADEEPSSVNCELINPTEELSWLKEQINDADAYTYYVKAKHNKQIVFYNGNCNPSVNYQSSVYSCQGDVIGTTNDLLNELSESEILWKHSESECEFAEF